VLTSNQSVSRLYGDKCKCQYHYRLLQMTIDGVSTIIVGAQYAALQHTAPSHFEMQWLMVRLFSMSWYITLQISMQCRTSLTFFHGYSSRVNNEETALYITITYLSIVSQVKFHRYQIPIAMLHEQSLNTLLIQVIIAFNNERVFVWDLSDHTLQIPFNAW